TRFSRDWSSDVCSSDLLPSLNEGFGLPIIEAMATGTPVVTSNTGAMAEVGRDCAILVDVNKKSAIAGGLADLWRDDGLHERLRKIGRASCKGRGGNWVR